MNQILDKRQLAIPNLLNCRRCGGQMQKEIVFDAVENEGEFMSARCIQCGDIVDPVILMHRNGQGLLLNVTQGRPRH